MTKQSKCKYLPHFVSFIVTGSILLLFAACTSPIAPPTKLDRNSLEAKLAQKYCDDLKSQNYPDVFHRVTGNIDVHDQSLDETTFIEQAQQNDLEYGNVASCDLPTTESYNSGDCDQNGTCSPDIAVIRLEVTRQGNGHTIEYPVSLQIEISRPNAYNTTSQPVQASIDSVDRI